MQLSRAAESCAGYSVCRLRADDGVLGERQ
jgi:hypothetical protein